MDKISLDFFGVYDRPYHVYRTRTSRSQERPHYHDYYQLCFVSCGEIEHCPADDRKSVRLGRGDAFIIPPYFTHSVRFVDQYSEICNLVFTEDLFYPGYENSESWRFLQALSSRGEEMHADPVRLRVTTEPAQAEMLDALFEVLLKEEALQSADCHAAAHLVMSILAYLSEAYLREIPYHAEKREIMEDRAVISSCISYIDEHFTEPLSLAQIARNAAMSRSRFCMLFPQFTGHTLKQYITRKRVRYAEKLFHSHPELSAAAIAEQCGYAELSTFYRSFRKVTGLTPARYRELFCKGV